MSGMFTGAGAASAEPDVASEVGDAVADRMSGASGRGGAVFTGDRSGRVRLGKPTRVSDDRKYSYDKKRGRGKDYGIGATMNDRGSVKDVRVLLHELHVMFGVENQTEYVLHAFDSAMFFCHTLNGASVLTPGRAKFYVMTEDGEDQLTHDFDYFEVVKKLGTNTRRFFRAFADDIMNVNKRVLDSYDPTDPVSAEQHGMLLQVAHRRGLTRAPWLAHDTADACLTIESAERALLDKSKRDVIGATPNSADRMPAQGLVASADRYDSTTGNALAF